MAIDSHLAELKKEHADLKEQVAREWAQPEPNDLKISELKRRKLSLKDEIARLEHEQEVA